MPRGIPGETVPNLPRTSWFSALLVLVISIVLAVTLIGMAYDSGAPLEDVGEKNGFLTIRNLTTGEVVSAALVTSSWKKQGYEVFEIVEVQDPHGAWICTNYSNFDATFVPSGISGVIIISEEGIVAFTESYRRQYRSSDPPPGTWDFIK